MMKHPICLKFGQQTIIFGAEDVIGIEVEPISAKCDDDYSFILSITLDRLDTTHRLPYKKREDVDDIIAQILSISEL